MSLERNKMLAYGIIGGVIVAVLGGYLYVAGKGAEEFDDYLYENDLSDAIRYRDMGYSPLSDAIDMEDIELELVLFSMGRDEAKISGHLDSLVIEGVSEDDQIRISFTGYELVTDPSESDYRDNFLYTLIDDQLKIINQTGIEETRLDGSVTYAYDADDKSLEVGISLDADGVAAVNAELALNRARKLVDSKIETLIAGAMTNPQKQLDEFGKIELASFEAEIEDHGFLETLAYVQNIGSFDYAHALNGQGSMNALDNKAMAKKLQRELEGVIDEDSIGALAEFKAQGGDLSITIDTERPVPFSKIVKNDKLNRDITVEIEH